MDRSIDNVSKNYYTPANIRCRTPVVIFLSGGKDDSNLKTEAMYDLCREAVRRGFVDLHH
jgi:hypothetical protein